MVREFNGFGRKHEVDELIDKVPLKGFIVALGAVFTLIVFLIAISSLISYSIQEDVKIQIATGPDVQRVYRRSEEPVTIMVKNGGRVERGDTIGYAKRSELVNSVLRLEKIVTKANSDSKDPNDGDVRFVRDQLQSVKADPELFEFVRAFKPYKREMQKVLLMRLMLAIQSWKGQYAILAATSGVLECHVCRKLPNSDLNDSLLFEIIPIESRLRLNIKSKDRASLRRVKPGHTVTITFDPKSLRKPVKVTGVIIGSEGECNNFYLNATVLCKEFVHHKFDIPINLEVAGKIEIENTSDSLLNQMFRSYQSLIS